jgi:hypothetical protein
LDATTAWIMAVILQLQIAAGTDSSAANDGQIAVQAAVPREQVLT